MTTFHTDDRVQTIQGSTNGVVLRTWLETFPIGGQQQVVQFLTSDGRTISMRAAHLTDCEEKKS